ncbi:putative GAF sensor protein [Oscillochloris trichoides DG-6]|uniref:GAF sensor protein n=1 Tax=Oscillochloris trichoides DG-6 TaxID=765420 RepID=E1IG53_9CHLR|nr:GAF domain-containing protein [Oscillochloris trichoides]EFO79833.1 putative GAF sensor protein [Oscillochloris trichoides DG-6]
MTTPLSIPPDGVSPASDLSQQVAELQAENARLRAEMELIPSVVQEVIDEQMRRTSLLTQLAIEAREVLAPEQLVEQTLRAILNTMAIDASIILSGPGMQIELALHVVEGKLQPIDPTVARTVIEKGLAGWVMRHGSSVVLPDIFRDRRWLHLHDQQKMGCAIATPIRQANQTFGVLTAYRPNANTFNSQDLVMLEGVGALLGVTLSAARYQASERQRRDQAMTLLNMTQFLSAERSLTELAAMLNKKGSAVFGARWGLLFLSDEKDDPSNAVIHPVLPGPANLWDSYAELAAPSAHLAWSTQRIVSTNPVPDTTCLALPLTHHGLTIGSFVLMHPGKTGFSANIWSLLTVFTHMVAAACANVQLVGRLTEQAHILEDLVEERTQQLQRSRNALRVVFDSLAYGVVLLDAQERLVAANNLFCNTIIGRHPRELVGLTYSAVWHILETQPHVRIELIPGPDPARPELVVHVGKLPEQRSFTVRRTPVDSETDAGEQYLEFWQELHEL